MSDGTALRRSRRVAGILAGSLIWAGSQLSAFDGNISVTGGNSELTETLTQAATSIDPEANNLETAPQILAGALTDYRTLVQVLYDQGYFSPDISIRIDGTEAASILPRELPPTIGSVQITVDTGPIYTYGEALIAPLAPETDLPESFAPGNTATTGQIRDAGRAAVLGWRNVGHAKAKIGSQKITALHQRQQLDVDIRVNQGPKLRFGTMTVTGESGVRPEAIAQIAGFPTGEVYSPEQVKQVTARLQRTGAFAGVTVIANETPNADGTLDYTTSVIDQKLRRISLGGEISSRNGIELSALWTHRNLFGAAERLRIEGRIRNIGGQEDIDGILSFRLDEPAKLGPDAVLFWTGAIELLDKPFYHLRSIGAGVGARRILSQRSYVEALALPKYATSDDAFGDNRPFNYLLLPVVAEWDGRNESLNPTRGVYLQGTVRPMVGLNGTETALGAIGDVRGYLGVLSDRLVLAARLKIGTTYGAEISEISPEFLFYSGGAGTVRGQPYEELGVSVNGGTAGGRSTLIWNSELRVGITDTISVVGFYDYGAVDANEFITEDASTQAGAGIGLRYLVPGFGPLRADIGWPTLNDTGSGVQLYLGIGQAF